MSMAVSLETRGPFMDYKHCEFAARRPMELRMNGLSTKYLLKRAMRDILPQQILRRPKLGLNIPYKNWLRNELSDLLQDALSPARLRQQGIFQPLYVQKLIQEHKEGVRDHAHKLWQLLIFQLWSERYLSSTITGPRLIESRGVLLSIRFKYVHGSRRGCWRAWGGQASPLPVRHDRSVKRQGAARLALARLSDHHPQAFLLI